MDVLFIICGIVVSLVLIVAGVSKLRAPQRTAKMLIEFGFVRSMSPTAAIILPVVEIATGVALLWPPIAAVAAFFALMLLGGFTIAIVYSLLQGRRPQCSCFGQAQSVPISWGTALRNSVLTMAAALLVASPGPMSGGLLRELAALMGSSGSTNVLLLTAASILVLIQAWTNVNVIRQQGRLLLKIDNLEYRLEAAGIALSDSAASGRGLPVGVSAPEFAATTLDGRAISLQGILQNRPLALVFVNSDCKPCASLLPELERFANSGQIDIQLVTNAARQANLDKLGASSLLGRAAVQEGFELNDLFGVIATPTAVCIAPDGTIASQVAVGQDAIMDLLIRTAGESAPTAGVREIKRHASLLAP